MKNKVSSTQGVKRRSWSWQQYLYKQKAEAAPVSLFTQSQLFPNAKSGFKVGMKLEGIDPLHPSMFCVLTVAEVTGHRLRLHIDGYSECYDFWLNADSVNIRPAGWCQEHGRKLHPPKSHTDTEFNWQTYLESTGSKAAPLALFTVPTAECEFKVGMKLEAVDRKNPGLVCVASVTDVVQDRFLIHFDNWDDTYDYWCTSDSPYIHPVGWCEEQGRPLTSPQGHPDPENFLWEEYLQETKSVAAPKSAFQQRAPTGFQVNHRLEAVDRRNPMLIRVATIVDVEDFKVKIHYDGWSSQFDVWFDSDHNDLHPVGWCQQTGHPLEPPPDQVLPSSPTQGLCPTPGCRGVGHIKGSKYTGHHSAFGCPYSDTNMRKETVLPDRLGGERVITLIPAAKHHSNRSDDKVKAEYEEESLMHKIGKRKRLVESLCEPSKVMLVEKEEQLQPSDGGPESSLQAALHQSVFLSAMSAQPGRALSFCWEQHCKLLPGVAGIPAAAVEHWSVQQVSDFIESLPGCENQAKQFQDEQIDGRAFLLLTQRDIIKIMSIKLGPALKIYNSILMIKHTEDKNRIPAKDNDQSPNEDMNPSPSVDMNPSPSVDMNPSPSVDRNPSPSVDRNPSPSVDRNPSPSEDRNKSSSEDRNQLPSEDRNQSPSEDDNKSQASNTCS